MQCGFYKILLPSLLVKVSLLYGKNKEFLKRCQYPPKYFKLESHLQILYS